MVEVAAPRKRGRKPRKVALHVTVSRVVRDGVIERARKEGVSTSDMVGRYLSRCLFNNGKEF